MGFAPIQWNHLCHPDILTEDDPTYFQGLEDAGQASRTMYDRRSGWVSENAFLFNASFSDLPDVEIQVNPEFENVDAARLSEKYVCHRTFTKVPTGRCGDRLDPQGVLWLRWRE